MIKTIIKRLGRTALLKKAIPLEQIADLHKTFGAELLNERTFYFGKKRYYAEGLKMESTPGTAEIVIKMLSSANAKNTILDYGCGQHQSAYLRRMGYNVHSCDVLSMDIPQFTRIDPASPILPFPDRQFDISIASEVLEHIESPWQVLSELVRVSKTAVIISTPNPIFLKSREVFYKTGYFHWFTPNDFNYHISPIFAWQVELFCQRHNLKLLEMSANHRAFTLNDHGRMLDYAESLIFKIGVN